MRNWNVIHGRNVPPETARYISYLQESGIAGLKSAKPKTFTQDPFNPVRFVEDTEKCVEINCIICVVPSYKQHEHVLELREEDLILLLDEVHHRNDVLSVAEATEMPDRAEGEGSHQSSRRHNRRFREDYVCNE